MKFSFYIFSSFLLLFLCLQSYSQRNDNLFSSSLTSGDTCNFIPEVTSVSRCGAGTVELSATPGGTGTAINWYDAPGGNLLGTGTSYTTPSLSSTTTYYVQEVEQTTVQKVGPADSSLGMGNFYPNDSRWINFDVLASVTLISVKVYSDSAGDRTIQLVDANEAVLQQLTANVPLGESRVTLNFYIDAGSNYSLRLSGGARLYRSTGGVNYPYTLAGVVSIRSSNAVSDPLAFYYFFYDWEVQKQACTSTFVPVIAEIGENISVNITSNGPDNLCSGDSVVLNAGSGYASYTWSNSSTKESVTVTQAGEYKVTVSDGEGCSGTDTIEVSDQGSFVTNISVNGAMSLCNGDTVALEAEAGMLSYQWSTGATTQAIKVAATGNYSVTVVKSTGCTGTSEPVAINVSDSVSVNITSSNGAANICSNDSVVLNAGSGYTSYEWSDGSTLQSISVTQAGDYRVTITNGQGCLGTDTIEVSDQGSFTAELTVNGAISLCNGDTVELEAEPGMISYQWSTGATTQTIEVMATGDYSVTVVKSAGCTGISEPVTVNVSDSLMPVITANGSVNFCEGDTLILEADKGYASYQWSTGSTTQTTLITGGGNYSVTVSDGKGCEGNTSKTFSSSPRPEPQIVQNGNQLSLQEGSNGVSYQWFLNGDTIPGANQATYTSTQNGSYTVSVANFYGCVGYSEPFNFIATGINLVEKSFIIYPNPTEGIFNIQFSGASALDNLTIEVYNTTGTCIIKMEEQFSYGRSLQINLTDYPAGNYLVRFRSGETEFYRQLIRL